MSGLFTELRATIRIHQPLCIFGDLHAPPGYILSHSTIINAHLTAEQQIFDYCSMSAVRTAVKWVFGDISTYFALLDF